MKKLLYIGFGVFLFWLIGSQLILPQTRTTLTGEAGSLPVLTSAKKISQAIVLDSIKKTGLRNRYSYTPPTLLVIAKINIYYFQFGC